MGRLRMATRKELTAAVSERYRAATRAEKARILDEFVVVTGFTASTRCGCYDAARGHLQAGERGRGFMMKRNAMR
ncbi:hypothetical protein X742_20455 [Mesorhizobium sp. LNHC232B00]|nr:hypothetical protein X742_20455 [Mesorhizobium sp. LNHC232B00]